MTDLAHESFDYIVIGGGSAGCVIANRLSADPKIRVLLIEAGPDFQPGQEPEALRDRGFRSLMRSEYFWSDLRINVNGVPVPYPQAKVIGGGSSINGMHGQRGIPRDYNEWRQFGVEGWSWDEVLPYFKRLESDADFHNDMHGADGPVKVCRVPEHKWSPLTQALRQVLDARGLPRLKDANGEDGDGTMPVPLSNTPIERASSAVSYLTRDVRARPNLRIMSETEVARVTFRDRRVEGVELKSGRVLAADNVFVCAGSLHTPEILLRSGIGPVDELQAAGVEVVADRPGVGRHLLNHPSFFIISHLKRAGRQRDLSVRPPVTMLVRYSSGVAGCPSTDMQLNLWERSPGPLKDDPLNRQMSWFMALMQKTYSEGYLRLNPADPKGIPDINFNLLSDPRDLERIVQAFKMCAEMLLTDPMGSLVNTSFIPNMMLGKAPDAATMKLMSDTLEARMLSSLGAFAMDFVPGMRAKAMGGAGLDIRDILAQPEDKLVELVKTFCGPGGHPAGTCRMGDPAQKETVVDSRGRVIGVEGLRVVDASIFPTLMNAGTNFPVLMAAEKVADMAIQDRRTQTRRTKAAA